MLSERVSLSCSPGWDKTHPGNASPLLCVKQRTCLQLWEGLGSRGSKAFYSHGRATFTNLNSGTLCFLEAFSDAMRRTGRKSGPRCRCCDRMGRYLLCNKHQMGAGSLITSLLLCLCASLYQQNMSKTVPHV